MTGQKIWTPQQIPANVPGAKPMREAIEQMAEDAMDRVRHAERPDLPTFKAAARARASF
jgi:hypothetical protein